MEKLNLTLADIIKLANDNPKGTRITSEIKEYINEKGHTVREFSLLA